MTLYSREYDFIYFYITLFKALDPRVAFLLEHAETLVDAGLLSIDDVARYSNTVSADIVAHCCSEIYSVSFAASLLTNTNITTSRAASILNSSKITADKAAAILSSISSSTAASILANSSLSADKTQSILYSMTLSSKLIDILTSGASNWTVSSSTTISGVNRYYSLTVNSGVTLSIDGQPGVLIVKNLYCYGTIAKIATGGAGGSGGATGAGNGGNGGGGLIIFADSLTNSGVINADGAAGGNGSTVTTNANGASGGSGFFYRVGSDSFGVGGGGGSSASNAYGGAGGINGGGGGGAALGVGGAGDGSSYREYSDFVPLVETIRKAAIDWVIRNVYGKSPTATVGFISAYGSGGGGGGAYDGACAGGGGGGGGGVVVIVCVSANNTGTVRANGGNGGNAGNEGSYDGGGGGGGGGIVYVLAKSIANVGTVTATGGSGGTGDYPGFAGSAGVARIALI
jgi:hypothetical protein